MTSLEELRNAGVPIRIAVIVMKQNEKAIPELITWLKQENLIVRNPDLIRPNGSQIDLKLIPSQETSVKYGLTMQPNFSTSERSFTRNRFWNPCLAGKTAITNNGSVIPCVFNRSVIVGNVKTDSIHDIIAGSANQKVWHTTKDGVLVCKDCEYRYACGDCRPLAESISTEYLTEESPYPRCTYNPYTAIWGEGVWRLNREGIPQYIALDHLRRR